MVFAASVFFFRPSALVIIPSALAPPSLVSTPIFFVFSLMPDILSSISWVVALVSCMLAASSWLVAELSQELLLSSPTIPLRASAFICSRSAVFASVPTMPARLPLKVSSEPLITAVSPLPFERSLLVLLSVKSNSAFWSITFVRSLIGFAIALDMTAPIATSRTTSTTAVTMLLTIKALTSPKASDLSTSSTRIAFPSLSTE